MQQDEGFGLVLGFEAELLAGGGVLVVEHSGPAEQAVTRFHDSAFHGHES